MNFDKITSQRSVRRHCAVCPAEYYIELIKYTRRLAVDSGDSIDKCVGCK